uniref:Putative DNA binding, helix-turn-helix domain containing protein n=1 Tax=viral metagenome TaxID=1070528 RepID=A0A6M3L932_9ZZZZ
MFYTAEEVAFNLNVKNVQTVYRWIKSGKLKCTRLGSSQKPQIRISQLQLDEFLSQS